MRDYSIMYECCCVCVRLIGDPPEQTIYLLTGEHNLFDTSATLYPLFMFTGMFVQYQLLIYRSVDLKRLIDDMATWVLERELFFKASVHVWGTIKRLY